jgi:tetratricopeptide (TPR) repeat protein
MLLLAEAYTIFGKTQEALTQYNEILKARDSNYSSSKDLYRKMAPLFTNLKQYAEAADCLKKVLNDEDSELAKVGLLTKIAGNYKKAGKRDECVDTSEQAFELMKKLEGPDDAQTWKTRINLGTVYQHFEEPEPAKAIY